MFGIAISRIYTSILKRRIHPGAPSTRTSLSFSGLQLRPIKNICEGSAAAAFPCFLELSAFHRKLIEHGDV